MTRPLVILAYPKIDHEKDYVYFWMPFSTLSIAKVLLDENCADVILFDGNQSDLDAWQRFLDSYAHRALCIGFSIMTGGGQIAHALEMADRARGTFGSIPLVFGGPHVNVLPEQTATHPLVDIALSGPGQTSMPHLIHALSRNGKLENVPGLYSVTSSGTIQGPENPPRVQRLGGYPWQLLDVERYVRSDPTIAPRTLNYVSSQGCVYKCRFCYELTYQRKYSKIPQEALLDEIEELVNRFELSGIKFYDADWFIDIRRAAAFAEGVIERNLNIRWAASINPNDVLRARRLRPDLLPLLARSGCTRLLMGIESGSDRVLEEIIQKEITRAQILDVTQEIAASGIMGSYTFIVGFPGETEDEEHQTYTLIENLWELNPRPETRVHVFAPYPGTPLYETAVLDGYRARTKLEDWSNYDYYDSMTPWTSEATVERARRFTVMRLQPEPRIEAGSSS